MSTARPDFDSVIQDIVDYVCHTKIDSALAFDTAKWCLMDSLGCGLLALNYPACTKLLGPVVPGANLQNGARVPGTDYELDPIQAAFNIGAMIRWLDYNDTWLADEWGHPSDNLGGLLAAADYRNRQQQMPALTVHDLLGYMIKAHEIQGVLALENSFNRMGLDHVVLVKVASTALITHMLGGDEQTILNAVSNAFLDGQSLRTYRHAPNTGPRKSWAAGDATARAVKLALFALKGEMGYPTALSAKTWGFYDVYAKGKPFVINQIYGSYVMENVLFKVSFPAEFHSQTAVEAAIQIHNEVKDKLGDIDQILIETQEPGMRIINKTGPLDNPADRDHCLQYIVAIPLLFGELTAEHYEDRIAQDPRIDELREKMIVSENTAFSKDYLDPEKRSIGNSVQVVFKDGSSTEKVTVEYPVGHKRRREEAKPLLTAKFIESAKTRFSDDKVTELLQLFNSDDALNQMNVDDFMQLLVKTSVSVS